jgi:prepilin-type N-terminal cleavage/methylation domain-containing protein
MRNTARKGFTLLELVVVVVVIGILAGIAVPTFLNSVEKSRLASAQTTAEQVFKSAKNIAAFETDQNGIGTVTDAIVAQARGELASADQSKVAINTTDDHFTVTVGGKAVRVNYTDGGTSANATLVAGSAVSGIDRNWVATN